MRTLLSLLTLLAASVVYAAAEISVPSSPPPSPYLLNANAFGNMTFDQPVAIASPAGETRSLFICEKTGRIKVIPDVTAPAPQAQVFLDLPALLASRREVFTSESESGLIGLAFHPQYLSDPQKRYFYVFYSVMKGRKLYQRVARFTTSADPLVADPQSELILIHQRDRQPWHQGGDMHFGPDGYLYISLGDEGSSDDRLKNSQRINRNFFSGILRIDVDKRPGNLEPNRHAAVPRDQGIARYSIPIDNPFVPINRGGDWLGRFNGKKVRASSVRTEFWAVGLRNPWRMSFDSASGDLWVGDVGQGAREEIDIIQRGGNYGWNFREGTIARPGSSKPKSGFTAIDPIYDYARSSGAFHGNCVIGGRVYHGTNLPALQGAYIFGDYGSGNIWTLRRSPDFTNIERIAGGSGIVAFGSDPSNGDILVASMINGKIQRLVANDDSSFPQTLSATGLFSDVPSLTPAQGVLPYEVNVPFWSDFAEKQRWVFKPNGTQMTWSRDGAWSLPDGMIWVKHFDMELTHGEPSTRKRLETRLLVKTSTDSYGVSYRWNDAQTEGFLVNDAGDSFPIEVVENQIPRVQTWQIPSRSQCMQCHTPQAGYALSFNTRQLNRDGALFGTTHNQLAELASHAWFSNAIEAPESLPRHVRADESAYSLGERARSYLSVNCAQCHRANGSAYPAIWDARPEIPLAEMKLVNVVPYNNGGIAANRLIIPGDLEHSVLISRINGSHGFKRMPPLGSTEHDAVNAALLEAWVLQELPNPP